MAAQVGIAPTKQRGVATLGGTDKVAALLLAMGRQAAASVLAQFEPQDIRIVTKAAAELRPITAQELESIVEEFAQQFSMGAKLGASGGYSIGENLYLGQKASTLSYEVTITVNDDGTWGYQESTILKMASMDNTEFMAQLAQFTSLEQTRELNEKLGALLATQATAQSIGLIGRTVDVKGDSGPLSGQVTLLDLSGSEPRLTVKQASGALVDGISLSQITAVH